MNFCSHCGGPVHTATPEGDSRSRHMCAACGSIHYQNPKMVVGCLPVWQDKLLLCRRAIKPRYGLWTLPAGFMENAETTQQGAARETLEEAGARVEIQSLYTLFNLPEIDQVYLLFRSRLLDLDFAPGAESLEVALFEETHIPWEELAFPVVKETLKLYFHDRQKNAYPLHSGDIRRTPGQWRRYSLQFTE